MALFHSLSTIFHRRAGRRKAKAQSEHLRPKFCDMMTFRSIKIELPKPSPAFSPRVRTMLGRDEELALMQKADYEVDRRYIEQDGFGSTGTSGVVRTHVADARSPTEFVVQHQHTENAESLRLAESGAHVPEPDLNTVRSRTIETEEKILLESIASVLSKGQEGILSTVEQNDPESGNILPALALIDDEEGNSRIRIEADDAVPTTITVENRAAVAEEHLSLEWKQGDFNQVGGLTTPSPTPSFTYSLSPFSSSFISTISSASFSTLCAVFRRCGAGTDLKTNQGSPMINDASLEPAASQTDLTITIPAIPKTTYTNSKITINTSPTNINQPDILSSTTNNPAQLPANQSTNTSNLIPILTVIGLPTQINPIFIFIYIFIITFFLVNVIILLVMFKFFLYELMGGPTTS